MTTVFTPTNALSVDDGGFNQITWKRDTAVTTNGLGQVRATFQAGSAGSFPCIHAGIAIITPGSAPASGTVTELLFSGASGFTITAGTSITSDWLTFSFLSTDRLMISTSCTAANGFQEKSTSNTNIDSWFNFDATQWNLTTATGFSVQSGQDHGLVSIETQSSGGGGGADDRAFQNGATQAITLMRERVSGLFEPVRELLTPRRPEFVF